ncbi:MAG: hypothetical protein KF791_04320 [Verrucomicrobiae bacterium]|nr:hypothetical protein [Verrucomicrobiae bacterium]
MEFPAPRRIKPAADKRGGGRDGDSGREEVPEAAVGGPLKAAIRLEPFYGTRIWRLDPEAGVVSCGGSRLNV